MQSENLNKLPEGVGKRIIESLKNQELQADYDEEIESGAEEQEDVEIAESVESCEEQVSEDETELTIEEAPKQTEEVKTPVSLQPPSKREPQYTESYQSQELYEKKESAEFGASDIDTLLNLISQLPSGVTKQTGALIIRQTMEAMGIPMNKVLGDAQSVQEDLEHNIRNNVNVIEEYRTKIKILEQEIQKYRKKSHELEDVISLFILSDNKR